MKRPLRTLCLLAILGKPAVAAEPDTTTPDARALTAILQPMMVKNLKSPALDSRHNWGHQKEYVTGFDVQRNGPLKWTSTPKLEKKNDGHWMHLTLDVPEPAKNLHLEISEVTSPAEGKLAFKAAVRSTAIRVRVEQQIWKRGVRILSNETRATCAGAVHIECEITNRLEHKHGQFLPDSVFQVKVTKAEVFYKDLMVEHTLGVGGDAAKLIGEATHKLIQLAKPSLEKDLIEKANAAIVKAGQSKEVRVSLTDLAKGKK